MQLLLGLCIVLLLLLLLCLQPLLLLLEAAQLLLQLLNTAALPSQVTSKPGPWRTMQSWVVCAHVCVHVRVFCACT